MGEYEPNDSRKVTQTQDRAPGEPPRTGPREHETRPLPDEARQQGELTEDQRGDDAEAVAGADGGAEQAMQQRAAEDDLDATRGDNARQPGDRND